MNLAVSIAVYASICKELGLPLRWGGVCVLHGRAASASSRLPTRVLEAWQNKRQCSLCCHAGRGGCDTRQPAAAALPTPLTASRPRRLPGTAAAWNGLVDVTDADLLADAMLHLATTDACANQV